MVPSQLYNYIYMCTVYTHMTCKNDLIHVKFNYHRYLSQVAVCTCTDLFEEVANLNEGKLIISDDHPVATVVHAHIQWTYLH